MRYGRYAFESLHQRLSQLKGGKLSVSKLSVSKGSEEGMTRRRRSRVSSRCGCRGKGKVL